MNPYIALSHPTKHGLSLFCFDDILLCRFNNFIDFYYFYFLLFFRTYDDDDCTFYSFNRDDVFNYLEFSLFYDIE